jgi:hypothetical protein
MTYMMITLGVAQGLAMLLVLAALRAGGRADRALEDARSQNPAA